MRQPNAITTRETRDPLTGLLDRTSFRERLEAECARCTAMRRPFGLILFDIDRFKIVNYGYGEQYGNALLQHLAQLASEHLGRADRLSRWGGQEFLCVIPDAGKAKVAEIAESLRVRIENAMLVHAHVELHATASFGTACFPDDGDSIDRLVAACGAALHQAKSGGRNRVIGAGGVRAQLFGVGRMLSQALREDRVVPAYQPIVDLKTGKVVAEEALARLMTPSGKAVPASAFIDAARELQLTYLIDRTIITRTFAHCVETQQSGQQLAHFVNISGNLLHHPDVVAQLLEEAQRRCMVCSHLIGPVKPLVIEITERELLEDIDAARELLRPFLDFGLRLALDDFGSGYSSYKYLADLPFAFLKIEGTLIQRLHEPRVRTIVQGIQRTAADLGLTTLAEFVEDRQTADIARDIGIDWGQGFHFGKPKLLG
jgi:diguanylate cyclase (GGDEF)-like protein